VYPRIGHLTNLAGYPPLKPNIIFCVYLLDHYLSLRMDHKFKIARQCQHWRFQVSLQIKNISGTYLIYRLFARGRATSKHGGGGRYGAVLEFMGEQFKKNEKWWMKENSKVMYGPPRWKSRYRIYEKNERMRKKEWKKERKKKEGEIWEREKNMSTHKVNSPVL
jgi:hypothetical protein